MTASLTSSPRLTGRHLARADLTTAQVDAMHALLCDHFDGVSREVFQADLAAKNWVVLLEDEQGGLRGFSTLDIAAATDQRGKDLCLVFSGDTIVARVAWGTPALPKAWIAAVYDVHRRNFPGLPLVWLLITSGFRTYRFLPVFWREFWPRFDAATPPDQQALLDHLARLRFGDAYDRAAGIVRLPAPQRLRGELRDIPAEKLADPHVAFFAARNPGYIVGDELVCLAELGRHNLTPAGRRMVFGSSRSDAR